jgi:hypothetical protein
LSLLGHVIFLNVFFSYPSQSARALSLAAEAQRRVRTPHIVGLDTTWARWYMEAELIVGFLHFVYCLLTLLILCCKARNQGAHAWLFCFTKPVSQITPSTRDGFASAGISFVRVERVKWQAMRSIEAKLISASI